MPHFGIRTDRYKLIGFYDQHVIHWELYDMKADPDEMNNLYQSTDQKARIKQLKSGLKQLMIQYKDQDALTILNAKS